MILVFDVGTTVLKGGIIDQKGSLAACERQSIFSLHSTVANRSGSLPDKWIETFTFVSKRLIHTFTQKDRIAPIEGVVVSGNGPTFVPVDINGDVVCNAISWDNKKSREYIDECKEKTGKGVDSSFYLAKAYMLFKQQPAYYGKVRWFLPCPEYISFFLTGNAYASLPAPGYTAYMWTDDAVTKTGMDKEKFPPFLPMGKEMGKVSKVAGKKTGIPPGIPVFAGGPDFIMSLLGTDTMSAERICDRTGTSEGINLCSTSPADKGILRSVPHIRKGLYNISFIIPFAGKVLDWFLQLLGKKPDDYKHLYSSLTDIPPGSENLIFLPHVEKYSANVNSNNCSNKGWTKASLWSKYRKGIFTGLTIEHTGEHLFKAIIEGIGYTIREIFELFEQKGFRFDGVRVSGIQASYEVWNTLRANITGRKMIVPVIKDTELTGCACVGLTSLGYFKSLYHASQHLVRIEKIFEPDPETHRIYTDLYGIYKKIYTRTDSVLQDLMEHNRTKTS